MLVNSSKDIQHNKEAENSTKLKSISKLSVLHRFYRTTIPGPKNKQRRKKYHSSKKMHTVKTQIMVNNPGFIIHKTDHEKGRIHMIIIFIKKIDLLLQKRLLM